MLAMASCRRLKQMFNPKFCTLLAVVAFFIMTASFKKHIQNKGQAHSIYKGRMLLKSKHSMTPALHSEIIADGSGHRTQNQKKIVDLKAKYAAPYLGELSTTCTSRYTKGRNNLSTPSGKFRLTIPPKGRLGNQMFQYASLLGIAHVNNRTSFLPTKSDLPQYFRDVNLQNFDISEWGRVKEKSYASKDPFFDSLPLEDLQLLGYFQSWKYFAQIPDTIKKAFAFKADVKEEVLAFYHKYNKSFEHDLITIGVHIRRTDFLTEKPEKGYRTASASYLKKAFQHMRSKFGDACTFFVVSDDPDWCSRELNKKDVLIVDSAPAIVHLGFLTLCDHVIMTVGTFSWWAAYLSGGHVVYYNGYPGPSGTISKGFSKNDFFMSHWVGIGD